MIIQNYSGDLKKDKKQLFCITKMPTFSKKIKKFGIIEKAGKIQL